jgi:hypothetical protein
MMARSTMQVTQAQAAEVETLAAVLTSAQIADFLGIGRTTFYAILDRDRDLAERYKRGRARAVGAVAQSLITKARAGNVTAMIFYLKTQGGWRETLEVARGRQDPGEALDLSQLSDEVLEGIMEVVAKASAQERRTLEPDQNRSAVDLSLPQASGAGR